MSRNLLPVLTILTAGSVYIFWKNYFGKKETLLDRQTIKKILITLRKRFFSTLREIAYVVQNLKAHEGLTTKKIAEIIMKNGSSAETKLNAIEEAVLKENNVLRSKTLANSGPDFQYSCHYYGENDLEIKILLDNLKIDIETALDGEIRRYDGPLPSISSSEVFQLYREVINRIFCDIVGRLTVVDKYLTESRREMEVPKSLEDLIKNETQIEDFLELNGVYDQKEPSEKLLLALVERNCLQDSYFELRMEEFQNSLQYGTCIQYLSNQKRLAQSIFSQGRVNSLYLKSFQEQFFPIRVN